MLESGYTLVGEFHYLHHGADGRPYSDIAELSGRIAAAAAETGIGLTLLPCFYAQGGFGGQAPVEGQRRFINATDSFARVMEGARAHLRKVPGARIGVAPHSLRAVTQDSLAEVVRLMPDGPIHIHAAEQWLEVEDCVAWSGRRPVEWLLEHADIDERWCLIHATHMTSDETIRLAESGAVAGLCPLTEASLGDGTFEGPRFLRSGGGFGIGTDSNIQIDPAAELRQLEYSQRLHHRGRNLMTLDEGESTGRRLFTTALASGARAMGQPDGRDRAGAAGGPRRARCRTPGARGGRPGELAGLLDFLAGRDLVKGVIAGGETVVRDGRHHRRDAVTARYRAALARLVGEV
jgi:formiminoglutamate deiminase